MWEFSLRRLALKWQLMAISFYFYDRSLYQYLAQGLTNKAL
jgi:hypothetical protein